MIILLVIPNRLNTNEHGPILKLARCIGTEVAIWLLVRVSAVASGRAMLRTANLLMMLIWLVVAVTLSEWNAILGRCPMLSAPAVPCMTIRSLIGASGATLLEFDLMCRELSVVWNRIVIGPPVCTLIDVD